MEFCTATPASIADYETISISPESAACIGDAALRLSRFGRFDVLTVLGSGAYGTVYRAHDPQLDRQVALKVPRASSIAGAQESERFLREARAAARLHHPHIMAIFDADTTEERLYIASELIEGKSLQQVIDSGKRFTIEETTKLISQIAWALDYAHQNGIVHRDIKPANILIDRSGSPHLADFGLARRLDNDVLRTQEGMLIGTPAYMSPEQAAGRGFAADGRTDQWSVGVIFYELLAGRRPIEAQSFESLIHQVQEAATVPLQEAAPHVSIDLATICGKCLSLEPDHRFPSCRELAEEIDRFRRSEPILSRPITRRERLIRWARRNPAMAALWGGVSFFALLSMVVAVGMLISSRQLQRTQGELHTEQARLKGSLSEKEILAKAAGDAALEAQESARLALVREQEAKRHLERFFREKRSSDRLNLENQQLESEQNRLENLKSITESKLKQADEELRAKERAIAEQKKKLADATWQEYVTCLAAADHAWMAKERSQVEAWLDRCPEEWRSWEWDYLWKYSAGDSAQAQAHQVLADYEIEESHPLWSRPQRKSAERLPYEISPIAAVSGDARRIGLWVRMLDAEGRPRRQTTYFHVTDLDSVSELSSGTMHHLPYRARDTNWRKMMVLSDDGRYLASTGEGANNRRRVEVADLQDGRIIANSSWTWRQGDLPNLVFSQEGDRLLVVFSSGEIHVVAVSDRSGAPPSTLLQQLDVPQLIGASKCSIQSPVLHCGDVFAVVVRARIEKLGLIDYPVLVLWSDRNGALMPGESQTFVLPPEIAKPFQYWRDEDGPFKHEFRVLLSPDHSKLAVVGESTALFDLNKLALLGDFRTPNVVGFSADGKRILALNLGGQLEVWDVLTGRQLPELQIFRRSVDFLRTLKTRFRLSEEASTLYRFDSNSATFYVLKSDEIRDRFEQRNERPECETDLEIERTWVQSYYVLGRLSLQAP